MFTIRTIFPDQQRVETGTFDLIPTNEQGQAVCDLFLDFLSDQPQQFRARLPFLKQGQTELEWMAGEGGAAFCTFFEAGEVMSTGILISGLNEQSDRTMLAAMKQAILDPLLGPEAQQHVDMPERPLLLNVIVGDSPELAPRFQLLAAALASVFFRVMLEMQKLHPDTTPLPE